LSPVNQYKKMENRAAEALAKGFSVIGSAIGNFFKNLYKLGKQRFTVMFIPHSEKKIFNFRISVFSLVFLCLLLAGVLVAFFMSSTTFSGLSRMLNKKTETLDSTEASLEILRDEIANLQTVARDFKSSLGRTLETLELNQQAQGTSETGVAGDLTSFINFNASDEGIMRELNDLQSISSLMENTSNSLEKITDLLVAHGDLLKELPSLWPLGEGKGRITTRFGPSEHPFTKKLYLHKGTDIAFNIGWPVLATADGKVVENKFEPMGFGNYIVIRHKYGFYTQYAHLNRVYVREGDIVSQGQLVGEVGTTGLSTGPHLHYEVRIGSQVVDPERYLSITNKMYEIAEY
jgi:murein DD-endopeptidase MepM/ murein hydrolase activator NlpD